MRIVAPPGAGSILAIAAHPEDIERWCAGTLARAADAGATVRLLLVTSGDKGSAVQLLGIAEVAFLRQPDGEVENARALRADLVAAIRRWRPFALFTHDP